MEGVHHTTAPAKGLVYLPDPAAFDKGKKYSKKKRKTDTLESFSAGCPSPPLKSPAVSRVTGLTRNGSYTPYAQSIRTATKVYFNTPEQLMSALKDGGNLSYFEREFTDRRLIGVGSFGEVYGVRSQSNNELYAVKKARTPFTGPNDRMAKLKEVHTLDLLRHPHCLSLVQAWEEKGILFIQTELCEMGDLKQFLAFNNCLPEHILWDFLVDLLLGLEHMHQKDLLHLDIKPGNIFVACMCCLLERHGSLDENITPEPNGERENIKFWKIYGGDVKGRHKHRLLLKIGDFGLAIKNGSWNGEDGDKCYLAPEILRHKVKPDPSCVGPPADIFSLGATMLEMLIDRDLPKEGELWQELREGKLPPMEDRSSDIQSLISEMMNADPELRPSASQLLQCHPRITSILANRQQDHVYKCYYEENRQATEKVAETRSELPQPLPMGDVSCDGELDLVLGAPSTSSFNDDPDSFLRSAPAHTESGHRTRRKMLRRESWTHLEDVRNETTVEDTNEDDVEVSFPLRRERRELNTPATTGGAPRIVRKRRTGRQRSDPEGLPLARMDKVIHTDGMDTGDPYVPDTVTDTHNEGMHPTLLRRNLSLMFQDPAFST